eukprot:14476556-Alexandrium_andersonii.AAC.1
MVLGGAAAATVAAAVAAGRTEAPLARTGALPFRSPPASAARLRRSSARMARNTRTPAPRSQAPRKTER